MIKINKKDVIKLLEENKEERGIKIWERTGINGISTFGIGLTKLKKLAKQVGKNHELALELWDTPILDAKLMSCIIENPKEVTRKQVESQVDNMNFWMLSHTYCSTMLHKTKFAKDLIEDWHKEKNDNRRRVAYLLLYQVAKDDKKLDDEYFEKFLKIIQRDIQSEENFVKDAMNNALWMIGQRNENLHKQALKIAKAVGEVIVDYGDNSCKAVNVTEALNRNTVLKKIGKL